MGSVDNESSQLNVANFFIPIVAVGFAGVITICYVYWTIIRKIFRFSGGKPLDEVMKLLVDENQYIVKSTRFKTVHIVMLEEVYSILTVNEDHLLNFTRAALRYYLT